jgi:hypothetical protein
MVANTSSPELIGIIVDVSNSMRRNWTKKGGKKEPRNKELKEYNRPLITRIIRRKNWRFLD